MDIVGDAPVLDPLVTLTVTLYGVTLYELGLPVITPVATSTVNPAGNDPELTVKLHSFTTPQPVKAGVIGVIVAAVVNVTDAGV